MFKVMMKVTEGYWHTDVFDNESEARTCANHAFKTGAIQVELYQKSRHGYTLIKKARQSMKQAAERCGHWMAEDAPYLN